MITKLIRPELKDFQPYTPSPTLQKISREIGISMEKIIKLDTGENPFVEKFQNKNLFKEIDFYSYPDPDCTALRKKLSSYTNYDPSWIVCGNGSDELIDLIIRVFVSPKEEIIINPPTFSMYEFFGLLSGAKIKKALRKKDLTINIQRIFGQISRKTKIVFIDSPGNPAGTVVGIPHVKTLLKKNIVVVVDEAYFEYCYKTVLPLVKDYPNLIVLRTFSKWAGLAGLRIGYLVANPQVIMAISSIKPPYNVNSIAQVAASLTLSNKEKILAEIKRVVGCRNFLIKKLSQYEAIKVFPTQGAYVVFKPKKAALELHQYLKKNGLLTKFINQPLLQNCLRVNLGRKKEINKLVSLINKYYGNKSF